MLEVGHRSGRKRHIDHAINGSDDEATKKWEEYSSGTGRWGTRARVECNSQYTGIRAGLQMLATGILVDGD